MGMQAGPQLVTDRLRLRRWLPGDREPFAAMNRDPEVVEFLNGPIDRATSDALAERADSLFDEVGYGLWAVQACRDGAPFAGFIGLTPVRDPFPFAPAVEVGWRLARPAWGRGLATEGARACLGFGFDHLALDEVVSFTAEANLRSRRVMDKLGMARDPADDFDHPRLEAGNPLRRHVLYRLDRANWAGR
ncbi:MAG: GNAT family N-acetyltransferase [Acidimicrobiales bacterium]